MLTLIVAVALSYLLGSVSGSLLLGRIRGVDIRRQGSGNAGGTNAFRTQGPAFALAVVSIDIGKGFVAAAIVPELVQNLLGLSLAYGLLASSLICGFGAVLGHVYPVFHQFRGGKGAGTLVGVLLATGPLLVPPVILVWALVLIVSGYVGLSTILSAASMIPSVLLLVDKSTASNWLVFALLGFAFVVFTHRSNIKRLLNGTEYRFEKARLFHKTGR